MCSATGGITGVDSLLANYRYGKVGGKKHNVIPKTQKAVPFSGTASVMFCCRQLLVTVIYLVVVELCKSLQWRIGHTLIDA